jgi:hypothetical protein
LNGLTLYAELIAQNRVAVALLVAGVVLMLVWRPGSAHKTAGVARDADTEVRRPRNTPLWRRLWWRVRPPHDIMRVDGLVIDRSRKPHCAWLGPTGAGKSASVATVRVNGERPTLIATPDVSDPFIPKADFHWTACESSIPVNFLIGTPQEVAERLTEVFRSGGTGAWKRAARMATAQVIRDIDIAKDQRTLQIIGQRLQDSVAADRELRIICAGWVSRFLDLADQFGDSIGPVGVDLSELLRQGKTVLLDNDAFEHPSLGGDVVALGLAEAKRCANLVPGGFRLIFEEAGQLGERIDLAEPFHRAGRRRKIAVDDLTQAESDLNEGISANIATRVYFAQELKSLQKIAADRLGLDYRELDPARMRDFTAWIAHGKIRRLVHFPKPPNSVPSARTANTTISRTEESGRTAERRMLVSELRTWKRKSEEPLALPPPSTRVEKVLRSIYPEGDCERWGGKHDKDGYGLVWLDGRWQKVHRVRWELAYGPIPLLEDGTRLTIDHLSGVCLWKDCSKLVHLEMVTRKVNSERRWRVVRR